MIAYLKGTVLKKTDRAIILSTGEIGYLLQIKSPLLTAISEDQKLEFFIHTHVREDLLDLYGFEDFEDLRFFKMLITISGVGPKLAMDILSVPTQKIKAAILNEDIEFMQQIPGIGQKSARRIVVELKGKIEKDEVDRDYAGLNVKNLEATEALLRLGYQKNHINKTLKDLPDELKEPEEVIRYFLKHA